MQITIRSRRAASVLWNNQWYPVDKPIDLNPSDVLHMSRRYPVEFSFQRESYNPQTFKNKMIGFTGEADTMSGFGNCTTNLLRQFKKNQYDVRWVGRGLEVPDLSDLTMREIPLDIAMIYHEQPKGDWVHSPFGMRGAIVPFETTRIPPSWVPSINSLDFLMVPCHQNVQTMIDSGVTIPVHEIRWGIDPDAFPLIERPDDGIFTFGQYGTLTKRKGTDVLISAFQKAFPPNRCKNVRLLLKTAKNVFLFPINHDLRIGVQRGENDGAEMIQQFLSKVDCLVYPTRGEGAGLPIPEALSTGIPVIATNWSGPVDYMNESCGWFVNYTMVDAKEFSGKETYNEPCGQWANPDEQHLIQLMRYAYEHQQECKEKGLYGARWVRENITWPKGFAMLESILKKYL